MKNIIMTKSTVYFLTSLMVAAFFVVPSASFATNGGHCTLSLDQFLAAKNAGQITYTVTISPDSTTGYAHIVNTTGCSAPLTLTAYKMFINPTNPGWLSTQTLFKISPNINMAASGSTDISVALPSCKAQVDLWYGTGPTTLIDANPYGDAGYLPHYLASSMSAQPLCTNALPFIGSCSSNPSTANIGDSVSWTVSASGGEGSYTYAWSGDEGLSGSQVTVSKSYATAGIKHASVKIYSGCSFITVACTGTIVAPPPPPPALVGSCLATPSSVYTGIPTTWNATASGGTGTYTYSWTGDDSFTGNTAAVSKSYTTVGTKNATVTITSGTQSITKNCSVSVTAVPVVPPPLVLSCVANPTNATTGASVLWTATPTGGTGIYSYVWTGSDSLSGTAATTTKIYSTAGTKTATVTVISGTDSKTVSCTSAISQTPPPPPVLDGSCSASPSSVEVGNSITWTAVSTGGLGNYTYVWTGDDSLNATTTMIVKNYTSIGTKNVTVRISDGTNSVTRQCSATVTAHPGGGGGTLAGSCSASATIANINDPITYSVSATGGNGTYTYDWSGTDSLSGTDASVVKNYSYTGSKIANVIITSGNEVITVGGCGVTIRPQEGCTSNCGGGGGGGGLNQPTVVLYQKAVKQPLAFVYLSEVPYTGIGGPTAVILFFVVLAIWGAVAVMVFRSPKLTAMLRRVTNREHPLTNTLVPADVTEAAINAGIKVPTVSSETYQGHTHAQKTQMPPINLPTGEFASGTTARGTELESELAIRAKQDHTLISPDGLKYVIEKAHEAGVSPIELLDQTIESAKQHFPREDGWILLNRTKVFQVLTVPEMPRENDELAAGVIDDLVLESAPVSVSKQNFSTATVVHEALTETNRGNMQSAPIPATSVATRQVAVDVNTFVNLLVRGDEREVFRFMRALREQNQSVEHFMRSVILDLDEVYRNRVEREASKNNIVLNQITSRWNDSQLETIIGILLTTVDQSYTDGKIGTKVASLRIASLK